MRLALNGWFFAHAPHTGSGQYLRALLEALPRLAPQHTYGLVVPSGKGQPTLSAPPGWTLLPVNCGTSPLYKIYFEQVLFPQACRTFKADLAHVPYWGPPLASPVPLVVTVHDLIPRLLPEYRGDWRVRLYTALVSAATPGAALVLTDSEASRNDLLRELRLPPERVRVVLLAAEPRYTPRPEIVDDATREKYGLTEGYVLYLGGFDSRKNIRALLSAWTWAADAIGQNYPLVLAGRLPVADGQLFEDVPALVAELGLTETVKLIGFVEEVDKPALYRGALAFVFPSRYEGFGLPPLEAMACGVPVIVSNGGSLPEIVGQAGYVIPPSDTRSIGAAIITCVVEPMVNDDLRARGLARAKEFAWDKVAEETLSAYQEVISQR